jgi:hypothetical protein
VLAEHATYIDDFEFFDLIIVNYLPKIWLIDKGPRAKVPRQNARRDRQGSSDKALKQINKDNTLIIGVTFL